MSEWEQEGGQGGTEEGGGMGGGSDGESGGDTDWTMDSGEEDIDDQGRNPTQQRIDEESAPPDLENEPSPHQGEEGTEPV